MITIQYNKLNSKLVILKSKYPKVLLRKRTSQSRLTLEKMFYITGHYRFTLLFKNRVFIPIRKVEI